MSMTVDRVVGLARTRQINRKPTIIIVVGEEKANVALQLAHKLDEDFIPTMDPLGMLAAFTTIATTNDRGRVVLSHEITFSMRSATIMDARMKLIKCWIAMGYLSPVLIISTNTVKHIVPYWRNEAHVLVFTAKKLGEDGTLDRRAIYTTREGVRTAKEEVYMDDGEAMWARLEYDSIVTMWPEAEPIEEYAKAVPEYARKRWEECREAMFEAVMAEHKKRMEEMTP